MKKKQGWQLILGCMMLFSSVSVAGDVRVDRAYAQVAITSDGKQVAIWEDLESSEFEIQFSKCPASGSWSSSVNLSPLPGDALYPKIAINDAGNIGVVWQQLETSTYAIKSTFANWGSSFPTAVDVGSASGNCYYPQIAMDHLGNMVSVWQELNSGNVCLSIFSSGSWGTPRVIGSIGSGATIPALSMNSLGDFIVAWETSDLFTNTVQCCLGKVDGTLSDTYTLSDPKGYCFSPSAAINSSGNCLVTWQNGGGTSLFIEGIRYTASEGTWESSPTTLSSTDSTCVSSDVALNDSEEGVCVWINKTADNNAIVQSASFTASSGWGSVNTISSTSASAQNPQVAISPSGVCVAVWENAAVIEQAIYSNLSSSWGSHATISDGRGGTNPQIVLNSSANGIAIWETNESDPEVCVSLYTNSGGFGSPTTIPE